MAKSQYENMLGLASSLDRAGKIGSALVYLRKAEQLTADEDELIYLHIWIKRLEAAKAAKAMEEDDD